MVIPIPFTAPTQVGAPSRYAMKMKKTLQVMVGLVGLVFVWSFVFVFYTPNLPGNRLPDAIIYGIFTGVGYMAQKDMDIWWVSQFGIMCLVYGIFSVVWFLDNWIRHAILPFTGSEEMIFLCSILWVPALILLATAYTTLMVWKNYDNPLASGDNSWATDAERQPLNRGASDRSQSNFEPFQGSANRLGTA